ncbi:armadillo-type protein [Coprinopsis sp. MPI-PUGE-AT-0042]|nr:armadillo-type protein [Coprinopsis sp. MPI-PUGE-AT-0042]
MSTTPAVPTLGDLKRLRNSVIGNPLAKRTLADDDRAVRILVDYLNPPLPHNAEVTAMRTEAAHIVASLAHGSDSTLGALLRHDAPRALLFAVSNFGPQDSLPLRSAFARALRTAGSALADSVGPPLYGIPSAERSAIHKEAKEALANFFTPESLDTTLPLLSAPPGTAPVIPTAVAQLVASSVRSPEYRKLIIEWVPADQRPYRRPSVAELEEATSPKSSRGWEKPVVSVGMTTEFAVAANGGWVVSVLVGLLGSKDAKAQEAALEAIGALVRDTPAIALVLVRSASSDVAAPITLVHSLIKSRHTDVQLAACLCATRIIRASNSSLLATHYLNQSDDTCAKSILSVVNRILASGLDDKEILIKACFILYYLIADDRKLSQFAFERGCLDGLATVFKQITPSEFKDSWDESEAESVFRLREAALTTLASFSLFDTEIRRCVTDKHELLPYVSVSLTCRYTGVRYAACQVVRMLSRAVGVLRTSITDSGLGMAVFELFKKGMDGGIAKGKDRIVEGEDVRVVDAALKAICNLVVEFSPLASKLLEEGVMAHLLQLIHSEDADDRSISLRLNAMWAVKNLLFKSPIEMKKDVMNQFGWTVLYDFLNDPSDDIREQAYNILRNVTENEDGISLVFRELCPLPTLHSSPFPISDRNLLDAIAELLSSPSSPNNVVVQATYVVANMANGYPKDTMEIVKHSGFLEALRTVIAERGSDVRRPAVGCILNLVQEREQAKDRRRAMVRAGVADTLRRVCEWAPITSAVSGSRPMARRMSHGTISGGAVGVPTVGGYLHPSDRTGVSVSPTQTRGTLGHQRSLTATFPVSNPGGTASIPGASQGVASPPGASPLYTALRTGAAATHSAVPDVSCNYIQRTYIYPRLAS